MNQKFKNLTLIVLDICLLSAAGLATLYIRYSLNPSEAMIDNHIDAFVYLLPLWLLFFYIEGLYSLKNKNTLEMLASIVRAVLINSVLSVIYFYLFRQQFQITPKTNIAIFSLIVTGLTFASRYAFFRLVSLNAFIQNTAIIGPKELCLEIENYTKKNPLLGYNIVEKVHDLENCAKLVSKFDFDKIDLVAIESKFLDIPDVMKLLYKNLSKDIRISSLVDYMELVSGEVAVKNLNRSWVLRNFAARSNKRYFILKSLFDRAAALVLIVLLSPLLLLTLLLLLIFNGRPVFFVQKRTGYLNDDFLLYKLRTMIVDAEKNGIKWATPGDSRVTKVGKFLRKTRLDELPQLWNVLKGDMSLVGPRPERPEMIVELEKKIPFYNARHLVKPGVTGWAQINFGYGFSDDDALKKLKFDLYYTKHKSVWFDLRIILKTIKTVITGAGH